MRTTQLNHVALHVVDLRRSCEFYENVLQLEEMPRPEFDFPGAWYRLGEDQELHLIGGRDQPVHSKSLGNHFALMVDEMDPWEQFFQENGVEHLPRHNRPDGAEQIFLVDPDGHYIELCTSPGL